jgi:hypothetical protein
MLRAIPAGVAVVLAVLVLTIVGAFMVARWCWRKLRRLTGGMFMRQDLRANTL